MHSDARHHVKPIGGDAARSAQRIKQCHLTGFVNRHGEQVFPRVLRWRRST
jgi:hypothetical protein